MRKGKNTPPPPEQEWVGVHKRPTKDASIQIEWLGETFDATFRSASVPWGTHWTLSIPQVYRIDMPVAVNQITKWRYR